MSSIATKTGHQVFIAENLVERLCASRFGNISVPRPEFRITCSGCHWVEKAETRGAAEFRGQRHLDMPHRT